MTPNITNMNIVLKQDTHSVNNYAPIRQEKKENVAGTLPLR